MANAPIRTSQPPCSGRKPLHVACGARASEVDVVVKRSRVRYRGSAENGPSVEFVRGRDFLERPVQARYTERHRARPQAAGSRRRTLSRPRVPAVLGRRGRRRPRRSGGCRPRTPGENAGLRRGIAEARSGTFVETTRYRPPLILTRLSESPRGVSLRHLWRACRGRRQRSRIAHRSPEVHR